MKKEYILPNGVTTTNENQYICDWQSLAQTIERGLDVTVLASNPGFQIGDKDGAVTSIPMWLVRKIIGITEERDEARSQTWYLLYGGTSEDGMGIGPYIGRTIDKEVARNHHAKCRKNPYSIGFVEIVTDTEKKQVSYYGRELETKKQGGGA